MGRGPLNIRRAFWSWAYDRYHARAPSIMAELAAFLWAAFFTVVYGGALLRGWQPSALQAGLGALLVFPLWTLAVLHRRIRLERRKGSNALYLKYVECSAPEVQ